MRSESRCENCNTPYARYEDHYLAWKMPNVFTVSHSDGVDNEISWKFCSFGCMQDFMKELGKAPELQVAELENDIFHLCNAFVEGQNDPQVIHSLYEYCEKYIQKVSVDKS